MEQPVTAQRNSKEQWNVDLTAQGQWTEKVQVFADLLNVFDIKPKFDPSAAYALTNSTRPGPAFFLCVKHGA